MEQQGFEAMSSRMQQTLREAIRAAEAEGRAEFERRFPGGRFECIDPELAGEWKLDSINWNPSYGCLQFGFTQHGWPKRHCLYSAELDKMLANEALKHFPPRAGGSGLPV